MNEPTSDATAAVSHGCVLIYDGTCRMCVTAKRGFAQLRKDSRLKIRMIPYQSDQARDLLGNLYRPGRPEAAYVADSRGNISQGLDAFLVLLPGLRGGQCLAALFRRYPAKLIGRLIYRGLAKYRYSLFGEVPLEPSDPIDSQAIHEGPPF